MLRLPATPTRSLPVASPPPQSPAYRALPYRPTPATTGVGCCPSSCSATPAGASPLVLQLFAAARLSAFGGLAAALLALSSPATASNVRLEDVTSPALKAGLEAATSGRFTEAERLFQVFLQSEPDSASAWSNLGNVHLSQGRAAEAVTNFDRAVELAPEAPVPRLNRAIAKEALAVEAGEGSAAWAELLPSALADCDDATELDPREFAAWFDKGNIAMRLGQYSLALESFRTAADLAPGLPGYRLRQAALEFQVAGGAPEGLQRARRLMTGVTRRNPRYGEAHAALAAVEWASGRQGPAEDSFRRAIEEEPRWVDMAFIAENTRWPPRLVEALQTFLSLEPSGSGGGS